MNEDKAARYQRLKRRAGVLSVAIGAAFLLLLLVTGASVALRDTAGAVSGRIAPGRFAASFTVAFYVLVLALANEILAFPLALYQSYHLEHRFGLSTEGAGHWLRNHLKSAVVGLAFGLAGASLLYAGMRRWPEHWWVAASLGFSAVVIVLANLGPVLLLPLFFTFRPLGREALRARLVALAARAGTRVVGAYEWQVSDRTRKVNAALTGLGRTRRVLVSDTLLADYSDDEIEVVLAHELAHHVYADIWKGLAWETVLAFIGFFAADRALCVLGPPLGLRSVADIAGLPLLLLVVAALSLCLLPAANALSRAHERRADRFALDLTRNAVAFTTAMRRLGAQNLAEESPSRLVRWLFYTHPPIPDRIEAAREWEKAHRGEG